MYFPLDYRSFFSGFIFANRGKTLIFECGSWFYCFRFNPLHGLIEYAILESFDLDCLVSLPFVALDMYDFYFDRFDVRDYEKIIFVDNFSYLNSF